MLMEIISPETIERNVFCEDKIILLDAWCDELLDRKRTRSHYHVSIHKIIHQVYQEAYQKGIQQGLKQSTCKQSLQVQEDVCTSQKN